MKGAKTVTGGELERLFIEILDQDGGSEDYFSTRSREGIFSPALVMWLTMCSRMQERKSLVGALNSLAAGDADQVLSRNERSKRAGLGNMSMNSGGLSRARSRLKVDEVQAVTEIVANHLIEKYVSGNGLWRGKRVYLMDGTLIALGTGEAIHQKYRGAKTGYGESKTGLQLCLCLHDLFSGIAISPEFGPYRGSEATSEHALARQAMGKLKDSALLMGDRNFGVFSVAYDAQAKGHDVLFRLTKSRAPAIRGKSLAQGDVDEEVIWRMTATVGKKYPELPADATLKGRYIQATVRNPGCKAFRLYLFSTSDAPKSELVKLYKERTRIEHDIRSLKYTIGLEMLYGKSPAMIEKELLLGVAAYNLLRAVIAKAALKLGIEPRKISFSRGAALTRVFGNRLRDAQTQAERRELEKRFLKAIEQSKLPERAAYRVEPRMVTRKSRQWPLMKTSREEARRLADKCLEKHGTREANTRRPSRISEC